MAYRAVRSYLWVRTGRSPSKGSDPKNCLAGPQPAQLRPRPSGMEVCYPSAMAAAVLDSQRAVTVLPETSVPPVLLFSVIVPWTSLPAQLSARPGSDPIRT